MQPNFLNQGTSFHFRYIGKPFVRIDNPPPRFMGAPKQGWQGGIEVYRTNDIGIFTDKKPPQSKRIFNIKEFAFFKVAAQAYLIETPRKKRF
jgi:hypothetical protein